MRADHASAVVAVAVLLAAVAGCSAAAEIPDVPAAAPSAAVAAVPDIPVPRTAGDCSVLSVEQVEELNGERIGSVLVDPTVDPPACFFTDLGGAVVASVWVARTAAETTAVQVVDRATPISSSSPASEPAGWSGGRSGGPDGSVYAVARGTTAIVVTTTQPQSVRAQRLALAAVETIG
ncbi:DUF2020 domain-containing protein [Rhodococcus sp. ACT016]|uniref:DUF2020 domain-containing protein n=1 Tax=Rhodococcus sp. ACT016 TaxID=3134808 RepID=UPI003D2E4613